MVIKSKHVVSSAHLDSDAGLVIRKLEQSGLGLGLAADEDYFLVLDKSRNCRGVYVHRPEQEVGSCRAPKLSVDADGASYDSHEALGKSTDFIRADNGDTGHGLVGPGREWRRQLRWLLVTMIDIFTNVIPFAWSSTEYVVEARAY